MNPPALDRSVLVLGLAQIAQPTATYDSKTDQTAQTDQHIEIAKEFGAPPGQKLTRLHQKLTSGTAQQPDPGVQVVDAPVRSTCPSDGGSCS